MPSGQQHPDRPAHRVSDRDHAVRSDLRKQCGGIVGAVLEAERLGRSHSASVPAHVRCDHPVGPVETVEDREEVEVGASGPAVQEQHGRPRGRAV
jgi:hypothetical protein